MSTFDAGRVEATLVLDRTPFQRGVREARSEAKKLAGERFKVTLDADITPASRKVERLRSQVARLSGTSVRIDVDTTKASAALSAMQGKVDRLSGRSIRVDADTTAARAQVDALQTKITRLSNGRIKVDADTAGARTQLDALEQQVARLTGGSFRIEADTAGAHAALNALGAHIARIATTHRIRLEADAAPAHMGLNALGSQLALLTSLRHSVRVEADTGAASAQLAALRAQLSAFGSASANARVGITGGSQAQLILAAIVAGLGAIGYAAPAAAAGLAMIPAALTGAGQLIGGLMAGLGGIGEAYKAMGQQDVASAGASTGAGQARQAAANQVKSATRGLQQAHQQASRAAIQSEWAVADAARAASDARVAADQRIGQASRALADARAAAAQRVAQADLTAERAAVSLQRAQENLTRAWRQGREELEDLQLSLEGGALSQERAALQLERARQRLAEGVAKGATGLDRAELELDVREAEYGLKSAAERLGDLREQQATFAREGVAGSQAVRSAREQVTAAEQAYGDAIRARVDAQRDGAKQVQAAEEQLRVAQLEGRRQVEDAERALARASVQAGWQQQDAAAAVAAAQDQLAQALASSGRAADGGSAKIDKLAGLMAKLTPEGREFVRFLHDEFVPAFRPLRDASQAELLPRLEDGMRRVIGLAPTLTAGLGGTARTLGELAVEAGKVTQQPAFRRDLGVIMESNNRALAAFGQAGLSGVEMLVDLGAASAPVVERFARLTQNSAQAAESWLLGKAASGELTADLQAMGDRLGEVVTFLGDVTAGVWGLSQGLAPLGSFLMGVVGPTARWIGDLAAANPVLTSVAAGAALAAVGVYKLGTAMIAMQAGGTVSNIARIASTLGTVLNPVALYSSSAMNRLGAATFVAGQKMGLGATGATRLASGVAGAASALPLIGIAAIGAMIANDALNTSFDEGVEAMRKGGASAAEFRAELASNDAAMAKAKTAAGGYASYLGFDWVRANVFGIQSTENFNQKLEEQRRTWSNLENAQFDATQAQGNYEAAVRQFTAASPEAQAALQALRDRSRDVEIQQIAMREKVDFATAALIYQRDEMLGTIDADLRKRQAVQSLKEAQQGYGEAIAQHGAQSDEAVRAGLQLEESQRRVAEAARAVKDDFNGSGRAIGDMVMKSQGQLTPTLTRLVSSMNAAELSAAGATVTIDGAGQAVARFPNGKEVRLSAEASQLQVQVQQAKTLVDTTKGTIGVYADTFPGAQAVGGFKLQTDLTRGVVSIDGNISPAEQQRLGIKATTDGTTGTMWINGNPVPADGRLNGMRVKVDQTTGVMTVDADPARAHDEARKAHDHANTPAGFTIDADPAKAYERSRGFFGWLSDQLRDAEARLGFNWTQRMLGRPGYAAGGLVAGYAVGGPVRSALTARGYASGAGGAPRPAASDTVPAWLTPGEYVIREPAVQAFGVHGLDAINAMGYAAGGPVGFAAGGAAAAPSAGPSSPSSGAAATVAVPVGADGDALPVEQVTALAAQLTALTAATLAQQTADTALTATQAGLLAPSLASAGVAALGLVTTGLRPLTAAHLPLQTANRLTGAVTAAEWARQLATVASSTAGQSGQQAALRGALAALQGAQQNTAAVTGGAWVRQQQSVTASTGGQNAAMAGLRGGMAQTSAAVRGMADGAVVQFGRMRAAAADPIRFVITGPVGSLVDAFNRVNADFGLGRPAVGRPGAAFAEGSEDHRAQIARAGGPVRMWAEPETGGEAYIPLASSKRGRSTAILGSVAQRFGYDLAPRQVHAYADGGLFDFKTMLAPTFKPALDAAAGARARYPGRPGDLGARGVETKTEQTIAVLAKKLQEMAAAGMGPLGAGAPFYVREIARAAMVRGLGVQGATIGVATALVESTLKMYANRAVPASLRFPHDAVGSDHDSVGLFQQRQAGWGTLAQRMNAFGSASLFFNKLMTFNWRGMNPGAAAQKVQVSAFPGRYQTQMGRARALLGQHANLYDSGGMLPTGLSLAMNNTGAGEHKAVFTDEQWRTVQNVAAERSRPAGREGRDDFPIEELAQAIATRLAEVIPSKGDVNVYPRADHSEERIAAAARRELDWSMKS